MAVSLEKKAKMIECTPVHIKDEEIPLSKIEIQVKPAIHTCLSEDVYNSVRGIMDFIAAALAIGVLASILRDGIEG